MPSNETDSEQKKSAEPLTTNSNDSSPPQEDQRNNSVYDFLYHDARRVGSFLAQFELQGVPQQSRASESFEKSSTTRTASSAGIDVISLAKGQLARESATVNVAR